MIPLLDRIMRRVEIDASTGCWIWQGATVKGYGSIQRGRRGEGTILVHRAVYEETHGPIAPGFDPDHLCPNTRCCNPDHLEVVTHAENIRKGRGTKLSAADVGAIRSSCLPVARLAEIFGVSTGHVYRILRGEKWAHA